MDRHNLTVRSESHAHRLPFEGTRCVCVEYATFGDAACWVVRPAAREVIVCAGSVDSPKPRMWTRCWCGPRLRARGVEGLRIADGSNMPMIVSANTNAAHVMIGEMAAG